MTNLEYIVSALKDEIDDGGASYESVVNYNIECPYYGNDPRGHCHEVDVYPIPVDMCVGCKDEWLHKEYE